MDEVVYRELIPRAREVTAQALIDSLDLVHHDRQIERPYTIVNFVASVDGRSAIDGRSRQLSDIGDRELHRALRERADAVLAGTGTIAAEDYGRMLPAGERRERRLAAARSAEPLAVTVTRSGRLPLHVRLFAEPEAQIVVFAPRAPVTSGAADVRHEPLDDTAGTPLASALRTLKHGYGVRTLLCEGGPRLFAALLREGVVDALFLTLAPVLVGGVGPAVASGPPLDVPDRLELVGLLEREGSLFLRYAVS